MPIVYGVVLTLGASVVLIFLAGLSLPRFGGRPRPDAGPGECWETKDGGRSGRRVLLVGGGDRGSDEALLRAAGYEVRSCAGPEGPPERFPYGECPLLGDRGCALASGADTIVFGMELDGGAARKLLRRYRETGPATPVCVCTSQREAQWFERLLRGSEVLSSSSQDLLVDTVGHALAGSPQ